MFDEENFDGLVALGREKGPFARMLTITPDLADYILQKNMNNRSISNPSVKKMAGDIKNGDWQENGQSIIIDTEGNLNDGQHRLNAVMLAGKSIKTLVCFGVDRDTRLTVDVGKKRSVSDYLTMNSGIKYSKTVSTIGRAVLAKRVAYDANGDANYNFFESRFINLSSHVALIDFIQDHLPLLEKSAVYGEKMRTALPHPATAFGAAFFEIKSIRDSLFDDDLFFNPLMTGESLFGNNPVLLARNKLSSMAGVRINPKEKWRMCYSTICYAYNLYRSKTDISVIRIPSCGIINPK